MKENLDSWIIAAKDEIPDPGEYRRLNRAIIKERMTAAGTRRRRQNRVLLISLILVLLILFSGQISQLGSNGLGTGSETTSGKNVFRVGNLQLPADFTAADKYGDPRDAETGERVIAKVIGLSYGGKTQWNTFIRKNNNDKELLPGGMPDDPPSEIPDDYLKFLLAHFADLKTRSESDPPHATMRMAVNGIMLDFRIWSYEYPGYGLVTRYVGLPLNNL